jgi:hypothetical protein
MRKTFLLIICLLASVSFGQTSVFTPAIKLTAFSSQYYLYLWNSNAATLQEVLNGPCPVGSTVNTPAVYQWDPVPSLGPPLSVFSTDMSKYTYRDNVNISKLWIRLCYSLYGSVSKSLVLTPIMHDLATSDVYEPQTNVPSVIQPANYWSGVAYEHWVVWDFSQFALSSQVLHSGRYEFGLRVKYLNPTPPEVVDSAAVKFHSMTTFAEFTTSANVANLGVAQVAYTTDPSFPLAKITVNVSRPKPSTAQGGRVYIQCANGTQVEMATFGWNTTNADLYTNTWNMSAMNTGSKCGGSASASQIASPLVRGGVTKVGTVATNINGQNNGDIQWTGNISLY